MWRRVFGETILRNEGEGKRDRWKEFAMSLDWLLLVTSNEKFTREVEMKGLEMVGDSVSGAAFERRSGRRKAGE